MSEMRNEASCEKLVKTVEIKFNSLLDINNKYDNVSLSCQKSTSNNLRPLYYKILDNIINQINERFKDIICKSS